MVVLLIFVDPMWNPLFLAAEGGFQPHKMGFKSRSSSVDMYGFTGFTTTRRNDSKIGSQVIFFRYDV